MTRGNLAPDLDKEYRDALTVAVNTGKKILSDGGTALDAVEQTIRTMEDNRSSTPERGRIYP